MREVVIKDEYIKLDSLLKFENLVEMGSVAKLVIQAGQVKVNGEVETRRGKKIYNGDIVEFNGEKIKVKSSI